MHFFQISYTKYVIDFEDKKIPKRIISKSTVYTILLFWKLRIFLKQLSFYYTRLLIGL